ncbi:hypothetical protein L5515_002959 [Caenorhabditis briggsae]|uniref:Uncharacterized protein n=1 Tax=Caenorhabditis briggsae TaxID=6238 RepID=A0AAE9JB64_CAEBR|nr:hypothetical protein L5515_002959 [Caenorhabditis briggsae]
MRLSELKLNCPKCSHCTDASNMRKHIKAMHDEERSVTVSTRTVLVDHLNMHDGRFVLENMKFGEEEKMRQSLKNGPPSSEKASSSTLPCTPRPGIHF